MERLGEYELLTRLGAGGMAETFLALRTGTGGFEQRVCVKRVLEHLRDDAEILRLFLQEAQLSARLRHSNIAQVIDFGEHQGTHYLVLEYVEGMDLRALMRRTQGALPVEIITFIATEMAKGLEYAHAEGVFHRDISPSNVLLSRAGEVKVADFGIAKAVGMTAFTRTGAVKGKVPYMAPEYARRGEFDARSDLFSLGVTLFELVGGRRPFDGKSDPETVENILKGTHPNLSELSADTPPALVEAIHRCIAATSEARFRDAKELRHALGALKIPATARRELAKRVKAAGPQSVDAHEPTQLASRTLAQTDLPDAGPKVVAAGPSERTRTAVPVVQTEVAISAPVHEPDPIPSPKIPWIPIVAAVVMLISAIALVLLLR